MERHKDEYREERDRARAAESQHELEQQRRMWELLADSRDRFGDYFPTRVMAALHAEGYHEEWISGLLGAFRKVVVVATIAAGLLVVHNIAMNWEARRDLNAAEMTLAIPPATIQSSLDHLDFGL
jgi:hypothetical protein